MAAPRARRGETRGGSVIHQTAGGPCGASRVRWPARCRSTGWLQGRAGFKQEARPDPGEGATAHRRHPYARPRSTRPRWPSCRARSSRPPRIDESLDPQTRKRQTLPQLADAGGSPARLGAVDAGLGSDGPRHGLAAPRDQHLFAPCSTQSNRVPSLFFASKGPISRMTNLHRPACRPDGSSSLTASRTRPPWCAAASRCIKPLADLAASANLPAGQCRAIGRRREGAGSARKARPAPMGSCGSWLCSRRRARRRGWGAAACRCRPCAGRGFARPRRADRCGGPAASAAGVGWASGHAERHRTAGNRAAPEKRQGLTPLTAAARQSVREERRSQAARSHRADCNGSRASKSIVSRSAAVGPRRRAASWLAWSSSRSPSSG